MAKEFELKFAATPEQQGQIAEAYGPFAEISMETTYFDTPGRTFSGQKMTLRSRLENGRCIYTLKTPLGDNSRREFELEETDIQTALPILCKLANLPEPPQPPAVRPVCGARFTRRAKTLTFDNCTVEIALDNGVLTAGSKEFPLCEIEVELKEGAETDATLFAQMLATRFGLTPEPKSKFQRAMALARQAESR